MGCWCGMLCDLHLIFDLAVVVEIGLSLLGYQRLRECVHQFGAL